MQFIKVLTFPELWWAVTVDNRVFLRLLTLLNFTEVCYENQRWYPTIGFSENNLLPTDPHPFSNQNGKAHRKLDAVKLPSELWDWDDSWQLELAINNGREFDKDGWMYSFDFIWPFAPLMTSNSYVRKRKWIRNRSYNKVGWWVPLPNSAEPITDIAAGIGNQPVSSAEDSISLWAVTDSGSLLFRDGVSLTTCPEGNQWLKIETPASISQVVVTPKGVVVVVVQSGQLFARDSEVTGNDWLEVPPPNNASYIDKFIDAKRLELRETKRKRIIAGAVAGGVGAGILVGVAAPFAIPALLGTVGFTSAGVAAGSIAAGIQAGIGNVAAGSLFAVSQSVAAAGIATSTATVIGAGTAVAGGAIAGSMAAVKASAVNGTYDEVFGEDARPPPTVN